jgi:uncharacterized protein YndB with AHSA1/START domain
MSEEAVIRLEHRYVQAPAAVWRALTEPELLARWFVKGDIRPIVGHRFALDMGKWGMQPCEVIAVETERLIAYRFAIGSLNTTISWQLTPLADGTLLTLTHAGFDLDSPLGKTAFEGMSPGWPGLLQRLGTTL